jgi:acetyl esterase/lipase
MLKIEKYYGIKLMKPQNLIIEDQHFDVVQNILQIIFVVLNFILFSSTAYATKLNIAYDKYEKNKLDIYFTSHVNNAKVILYFHGGGLIEGDKKEGAILAKHLVDKNLILVSVNYRLSPEVRYPTHVQDAANAVKWIYDNIEKYGGNKENIYLSGFSAGGYLAALLSVDNHYLEKYDLHKKIKGSILISPFLYVEETAKVRDKSIWGEDVKIWLDASVSPYINHKKFPFLLIYADGDEVWRKGQNELFKTQMQKVNNVIETAEVWNRNHQNLVENISKKDDKIIFLIKRFLQKY